MTGDKRDVIVAGVTAVVVAVVLCFLGWVDGYIHVDQWYRYGNVTWSYPSGFEYGGIRFDCVPRQDPGGFYTSGRHPRDFKREEERELIDYHLARIDDLKDTIKTHQRQLDAIYDKNNALWELIKKVREARAEKDKQQPEPE